MAKWHEDTTDQLTQLKQDLNLTDREILDLRKQITTWSDHSGPNDEIAALDRVKGWAIRVTKRDNWIIAIEAHH